MYTKENGYANKNFIISPLSLRLALILCVDGASGKTQKQLIKALGFHSYYEMQNWCYGVLNSIDSFKAYSDKKLKSDSVYRVANSVWGNSHYISDFNRDYARDVSDKYNAEVIYTDMGIIDEEVSNWVNEKTDGFISNLDVDLSYVPITLINLIYLRASWLRSFNPDMTEKGYFTTINGEKTEKDFMQQTERYLHYSDTNTELVVVPLCGNLKVVFVKGSEADIKNKINQATKKEVSMYLPKFEISNKFEDGFFIDYFYELGYELPFSSSADYTKMLSDNREYNISDICQITRIKTNEEGLEASAVTMNMLKGAVVIDELEHVKFMADSAFGFYILDSDNHDELIFYGQIAE